MHKNIKAPMQQLFNLLKHTSSASTTRFYSPKSLRKQSALWPETSERYCKHITAYSKVVGFSQGMAPQKSDKSHPEGIVGPMR
jgi:hypothetical protein